MNFISEKDISKDPIKSDGIKFVEPVDNRPLYDRLKEVRDKKQLEYEEAHKFKNQFRGIDEDEADFLRSVDLSKSEAEALRKKEERELIKKTMTNVVQSAPADSPTAIRPKSSATKSVSKQASLLSNLIRKRPHPEDAGDTNEDSSSSSSSSPPKQTKSGENEKKSSASTAPTLCRVMGIIPSLVAYDDSSDEDSESNSSNSEADDTLGYLAKASSQQQNSNGRGSTQNAESS